MKKITNLFLRILTLILICLIRIYQLIISPILKTNCRFIPTCSQYSLESIKEYGPFVGLYMSTKRILSCHPLGKSGYDPIKKRK